LLLVLILEACQLVDECLVHNRRGDFFLFLSAQGKR